MPRDKWTVGLVVTAVIFVIIVLILFIAGCGEDVPEGSGCVGTVTKTYTEYKPGVSVVSGNLSIPTGSTRYYIAVEKSDGTFCSKRLDKGEWLGIKEGDTYG